MTTLQHADVSDRTRGLGGSDAAAILGLNPWKTPLDVYHETLGLVEPDNLDDKPVVEWGNRHEEQVAAKYAEVTGRKVYRSNRTLQHAEHPFLVAHIDRRVKTVDGVRRVLECKTAYPRTPESWDQWGEAGTDEVPIQYLCQCMHYLAVTGADQCDLAVLINGWDFRIYHIARDEELVRTIVAKEVAFWRDHIEAKNPPPPSTPEDVAALYPENNGHLAQIDLAENAELVEMATAYRNLRATIKDAEEEAKRLKAKLTEAVGDFDGLTLDGKKPLVTWKAQTRTGWDTKRLAAEHPELAAEYMKETRFRVLRLTKALDGLAG